MDPPPFLLAVFHTPSDVRGGGDVKADLAAQGAIHPKPRPGGRWKPYCFQVHHFNF